MTERTRTETDAVASTEEAAALPPSTSGDRSGEKLGHFRLLSKLGEGGMGVVYAAEDGRLGRTVALKILPPAALANPERRRRFLREARAASAVMHPSIAAIFEVGEDRGEVFLAMERVSGRTLRSVLSQSDEPLAVGRALALVREIAQGLEHAHRAGVVHRDLKPENVMETPGGTIKILDFGLAKRIAGEGGERSEDPLDVATVEGKILGTPGYMAPEQAHGGAVDGRTDIFSLGAMLYEMLTGERPFRGQSSMAVLIATDRDPATPPSARNPSVPAAVDRLVLRCLEKRPDDRFASCAELIAAVDVALSPMVPAAARTAAAEPKQTHMSRKLLAAVVAVALLVGAAALLGKRFAQPDAGGVAASGSAVSAAAPSGATATNSATAASATASGGPASDVAGPLRRPCLDGEPGKSECHGRDLVAWCDPGGRRVGCCGAGLVPKDADGICGCAAGGTKVAAALSRGCAAVPSDAKERYTAEKMKAMHAAIACFDARSRITKISGGVFGASFFLTPEGEVFGARVEQCTLPDEVAQSCALAALRATRFPPPSAEDAGKKLEFGFEF